MRAPEYPQYALVLQPENEGCVPTRITLDALPAAVQRGALVIAREDAILSERVSIDLTELHSNPRRVAEFEE